MVCWDDGMRGWLGDGMRGFGDSCQHSHDLTVIKLTHLIGYANKLSGDLCWAILVTCNSQSGYLTGFLLPYGQKKSGQLKGINLLTYRSKCCIKTRSAVKPDTPSQPTLFWRALSLWQSWASWPCQLNWQDWIGRAGWIGQLNWDRAGSEPADLGIG